MCFVQNLSRFLFRSIWLSDLWFFLYSYIFIVLIKKIFYKNSDIYRIEKVILIIDEMILFYFNIRLSKRSSKSYKQNECINYE